MLEVPHAGVLQCERPLKPLEGALPLAAKRVDLGDLIRRFLSRCLNDMLERLLRFARVAARMLHQRSSHLAERLDARSLEGGLRFVEAALEQQGKAQRPRGVGMLGKQLQRTACELARLLHVAGTEMEPREPPRS